VIRGCRTRRLVNRNNLDSRPETAQQLRDPGLEFVKTDALLDPLRNEPRFLKVMRELRFPS
jgi:hypothetical protein